MAHVDDRPFDPDFEKRAFALEKAISSSDFGSPGSTAEALVERAEKFLAFLEGGESK